MERGRRLGALCGLAVAVLGWAPALAAQRWLTQRVPEGATPAGGDLFVANIATLWPGDGPPIHGASILIRRGRIAAVGTLPPPPDVPSLDGSGLTVIPGLIDAHSHIGLEALSETGDAIVPEVRVLDGLDPTRAEFGLAVASGITTALLLHGSSRPIGGEGATVKIRWGESDPNAFLIDGAPRTIKFALGENVRSQPGGDPSAPDLPRTTPGLERLLDSIFTAAARYGREPNPPDARQERLLDVLEGRLAVHAHAYRASDMLMLLALARRHGFRVDVFTHGMEAYKIAPELVSAGTAVSVFVDMWGYKHEAADGIPATSGLLQRAGVRVSINSDLADHQPLLLHDAGKALKYGGLRPEDALRLVTMDAATLLHLEDRVGSIAPGKDGDLVLLTGDPFSTYTRVAATIVEGRTRYRYQPRARAAAGPAVHRPAAGPKTCGWDTASGGQAIVGGTVHPIIGSDIPNGVVVWHGDRLTCVGRRGRGFPTRGARIVNATGLHVYPGMIDPHTQLGLIGNEGIAVSRQDAEGGAITPDLDPLFGIQADDPAIARTRANGVTTVLVLPGGGTVPGAGTILRLRGATPTELALRRHAVLSVDLPPLFGSPEPSVLRTGPWATIFRLLSDTLSPGSGPFARGERPVLFSARGAADLRGLLLLLDALPKVRAVLLGGDAAPAVAPELAARGIPVIVTSSWHHDPGPGGRPTGGSELAAVLAAAGVRIAFSGTRPARQDFANVRNLPYNAGRAVAFGLDSAAALQAVTLNAAEALGVGDELGSLEPGKRADLLVTDGDPLQVTTRLRGLFIGGVAVPLRTRDDELLERFRNRVPRGPGRHE